MRKHGWQLPYHPLQVVAIAVFLALGFAFYVFFLPFVGKKLFEYVVLGLYTPLLETDPDILLKKADMALKKYQMHVVVANELEKRKEEVTVVTESGRVLVHRDNLDTDVEDNLFICL